MSAISSVVLRDVMWHATHKDVYAYTSGSEERPANSIAFSRNAIWKMIAAKVNDKHGLKLTAEFVKNQFEHVQRNKDTKMPSEIVTRLKNPPSKN